MFNPKRKGFFPYIYVALEQSLSDEDQWVDFESACQKSPGGSAGLTFAHGLLCRQEKRNLLQIVQVNCGEKCGKKSAHNREAGNAQFYAGNFKQAQLLYSVAVFTAPTNNDNGNDNLPLALANRSACFQRLKAPQLALNDIEFALQTGYPPNKAFKLLERRGECILALKQDLDKGLEAFEKAKQLVGTKDKKRIQEKIEKLKQTMREEKEGIKDKNNNTNDDPDDLIVESGANRIFPAAHPAVTIQYEAGRGRFAVASEDIEAGTTLVREAPFIFSLNPEQFGTHCQTCFSVVIAVVPCPNCTWVCFCTLQCRDKAMLHFRSAAEMMVRDNDDDENHKEENDVDIFRQHHEERYTPTSRVEYMRMIFDVRLWRVEAVDLLASTSSGLYATILAAIYIAFSFTEIVTFPRIQDYLEIKGFFIYLFALSDIYLLYILCYVLRRHKQQLRVVENTKSHGSLTVRIGAIIFGLGTFAYFTIEFVTFFESSDDSPCYHGSFGANNFLALVFVFLQAYIIFMYPRLNLNCHHFWNRLGTMHIVATNVIVWIRTLIKESLEEITEFEEEESHAAEVTRGHRGHSKCNYVRQRVQVMEAMELKCQKFRHDILGENVLTNTSPYLYPFVIEYTLIGASVYLIMSSHIGQMPDPVKSAKVQVPKPIRYLKKSNMTHTAKGAFAGLAVILVAVVNLCLFFGLDGHNQTEDEAEYVSKISNTVINMIGIVALVVGIAELQHLDPKNKQELLTHAGFDLDMALLRFTSFFSLLYMIFTIITGSFNTHVVDFPNELHIINGLVEMVQIVLQICFIHNLKHKVSPENQQFIMPGRQVTVFLFLFNLAQWIVFTFEIQKVRASLVEADFYGFMPWVIIQRVTLPLAVFFRFHSAVVSIELWKEVYINYEPRQNLPTTTEQGQQATSSNREQMFLSGMY